MWKKSKQFFALLLVCVMSITTGSCESVSTAKAVIEPVVAEASVGFSVTTSKPRSGDIEVNASYIGAITPQETVYVFPTAQTEFKQIYVKVGDTVSKGQVLAKQDDEYIQDQVLLAKLQYDSAVAQVEQALGSSYDSQMNTLNSTYDTAINNYESAKSETQSAKDNRTAANKALTTLKASLESLDPTDDDYATNYAAIYEQIAETEVTIAALTVSVKACEAVEETMRDIYVNSKEAYQIYAVDGRAEAENSSNISLELAEKSYAITAKQLDTVKLEAPISGVIEAVNVKVDQYPDTSSPAVIISNKDVMSVSFGVSGTVSTNLALGDVVVVDIDGKDYYGIIDEIDTMSNMQTGLFTVSAVMDLEGKTVAYGQQAKVTVVSKQSRNTTIIDQDSVYYESGVAYVYINKGGYAVKTYIETGLSTPTEIEVVSGISRSDSVITSWHPNLVDGAMILAVDG